MSKLITRKYQIKGENAKNNGMFYTRIVHTETLSTNEFANHIKDHGSPFDRATIVGVLTAACDCLVELTMDSKKVCLGDLGTFYMSAETEGAEKAEDLTADNVKKVHLRFLPNLTRAYALDSVSNRKKASFKDLSQLDGSANEKTPAEPDDVEP